MNFYNTFFDESDKGWVEMKLSHKDARKRIYKLKSPEQAVKEMNSER